MEGLRKARAFRDALAAGELSLGAQLTLQDPSTVEIFARAGYTWLVVDTEHSAHDLGTVKAMLQAGAGFDAVLLVRTLRLDVREIGRYLDLGAHGVLCPFVETASQAALLVKACRYPPEGLRGYGPRRASGYGFDAPDYFAQANESLICIPILETKRAVANAREIVAVEGINAVLVGPMDLSIDIGTSGDFHHPLYTQAFEIVRKECAAQGKTMGAACHDADQAIEFYKAGERMLLVGGDDVALHDTAAMTVDRLESMEQRIGGNS